jgi:hypothetical protein
MKNMSFDPVSNLQKTFDLLKIDLKIFLIKRFDQVKFDAPTPTLNK